MTYDIMRLKRKICRHISTKFFLTPHDKGKKLKAPRKYAAVGAVKSLSISLKYSRESLS